ncbi:MAG: dTDP-4-amino-4,6-dideoxygalactose transaminase [Thermodesulfobacteriota bacterium]
MTGLISRIEFNKPTMVGNELKYIKQAINEYFAICGNGIFTKRCESFLQETFGIKRAMLTSSCTHALEMAALLLDLQAGDEVIIPSYTFVSTINCFVLRGAIPVFVDIREDTLNIDERLIEEKISKRTKAIFAVHYAGVSCEMDSIMKLAKKHNLYVVEDAAQAFDSTYQDKTCGAIGHMGAYSFHETKNCICGEGGALLINDEGFIERAEYIREKGTNRNRFSQGLVDKYTWVDIGSSYLMSDMNAAFLLAQFEKHKQILERRRSIFDRYYEAFRELEKQGEMRLPVMPSHCTHNAHMFYVILNSTRERDSLIKFLRQRNIEAVFHYIPLHTSPMGIKLSKRSVSLPVTEDLAYRLLRLPIYYSLRDDEADRIIDAVYIWNSSKH